MKALDLLPKTEEDLMVDEAEREIFGTAGLFNSLKCVAAFGQWKRCS
jgi:hypothetical protein